MAAPKPLVKWYGDKFKKHLSNKLAFGLGQAGAYCTAVIIRSFGGESITARAIAGPCDRHLQPEH